MSEETFWRVVAIFTLVAVAIGGALWKHIIEDGKVRERLATLEADSRQIKEEVKSIRQRLHELSAELSNIIASWIMRLTGKRDKDE